MTKLKIEVTADDDAAAVEVLQELVRAKNLAAALSEYLEADGCPYKLDSGTATATVEREETTEAI